MMRKMAAGAAALAMMAAPCAATAQASGYQELGAHRTGASLTAYVRLPLGRGPNVRTRPQLGFRASGIHSYRDSLAPTGPVYQADGLDFRIGGMGRPTLLVAGRPVTGETRRLNALGTAETIGIVVGGVLLLVVVAVAAGGGAGFPDCEPVGGNDDHCID